MGGAHTPPPAASAPAPGAAMDPCVGHWTGTWGTGTDHPYTIDMQVTPGTDSCGGIEYPSLGCGGFLTNCSPQADGTVSFTEVYTHNDGRCAPQGRIIASCTSAQMSWTWEGTGGPATAVLQRQ